MATCCFHYPDRHPSLAVSLDHGGFRCWSCGASGDMVGFLQQRYGYTFRQALAYLGISSTTEFNARALRALKRERERREYRQAVKKEKEREARNWLHALEAVYRDTNERLCELRQGASERLACEAEACWEILAAVLNRIRDAEADYFRLTGVEQ